MQQVPQQLQNCVQLIEEGDGAGEDKGGTIPTSLDACGEAETSAPDGVDSAMAGSATIVAVDGKSADTTITYGASELPKHSDGHRENGIQRQHATSSAQEPIGDSVVVNEVAVGEHETLKGTPVDAQALVAMRTELDIVRNSASGLEGALRESRSEVLQLREKLAMEEDTSRRQAGKIASLRYHVVARGQRESESDSSCCRTPRSCRNEVKTLRESDGSRSLTDVRHGPQH